MENEQEAPKVSLTVDNIFISEVSKLAKRRNQSEAEVIADAVNLLIMATDEWEKGNGILFIE